MDPVEALNRIAFLQEKAGEATFRVKAFRSAARTIAEMPADEVAARSDAGTLTQLSGIGEVTAKVVSEALAGEVPVYLSRLEAAKDKPLSEGAARIRTALRGDLHSHSDWSDGGSPIEEMARTAVALGHDYLAQTDHSPRLTVANGLSAARLTRQLDVVAALNEQLAPFRILTGIEVDILEDGSLDQSEDMLRRLDVVVASVHSKLRSPAAQMTERMVAAIANPYVDVLGHCTGRLIAGERGRRPESDFDAELVFAACVQFDVAVEINSRVERLDPPKRLLSLAAETGCRFSIDTDAHAPGQLDWQRNGCERAAACGVEVSSIVNTMPVDDLLAWTARRR